MNVYDFDNTILRGDSTARFTGYCFLHYPKLWLDIPGQVANAMLFVLKRREKQAFKQRLLSYLRRIDDVDGAVEDFWKKNEKRIKAFYGQLHRDDDVVISASPEFLIRPICAQIGVSTVMGSPVDKQTGIYSGLNCHGAEKVRRFRAVFPDGEIEDFYSDSHSDDPLASLAQRPQLVRGDKILPWNNQQTENRHD